MGSLYEGSSVVTGTDLFQPLPVYYLTTILTTNTRQPIIFVESLILKKNIYSFRRLFPKDFFFLLSCSYTPCEKKFFFNNYYYYYYFKITPPLF